MKYILFLVLALTTLCSSQDSKAQATYNSYLGALDTLTNADTTTYNVSVKGNKSNVSFQVNVLKISGTVAGTIAVYGSVDGTNYSTTALTTDTIANASANYAISYSNNLYQKYRITIMTTGTQSCSQRTYLLYRP